MAKKKDKVIMRFETFREIGNFEKDNLTFKEPSVINQVTWRKYRVTVELIDEPIEVLRARVQKLWDECNNYHHSGKLKDIAEELQYELQGIMGSKAKKYGRW